MIKAAALFGLGSVWTLSILAAGYRYGYNEGHNDATLYAVRTRLEKSVGDLDETTEVSLSDGD